MAIVPGYTETQSAIAWFGPRLASHGFVVITFDQFLCPPPATGGTSGISQYRNTCPNS